MSRVCCAVSSDNCTNPANLEPPGQALRSACYRCGQSVCLACSSVRAIKVEGRKTRQARICDPCLEDEPDGEAKVLLRRYHQAGYDAVTLTDMKRLVEVRSR